MRSLNFSSRCVAASAARWLSFLSASFVAKASAQSLLAASRLLRSAAASAALFATSASRCASMADWVSTSRPRSAFAFLASRSLSVRALTVSSSDTMASLLVAASSLRTPMASSAFDKAPAFSAKADRSSSMVSAWARSRIAASSAMRSFSPSASAAARAICVRRASASAASCLISLFAFVNALESSSALASSTETAAWDFFRRDSKSSIAFLLVAAPSSRTPIASSALAKAPAFSAKADRSSSMVSACARSRVAASSAPRCFSAASRSH